MPTNRVKLSGWWSKMLYTALDRCWCASFFRCGETDACDSNTITSSLRAESRKQHPTKSDAASLAAETQKKDAHQTWRPSVAAFGLLIVLSILSLTYGNFAFNSKTLPIFSQFLPKILSCIRREKQIQYFQGILLGKPPENGTQRCYSLFPQAVIGAEADIPDMRVERFNDLLHIFQLLWG